MAIPEELRDRLASADEEARHRAVLELGALGRDGLALLGEALGDPSWRVRKAAVELILGAAGPAEVLPVLVAGLCDEENAGRRNSSVEALVRIGPAAVPALAPLAGAPDPDLRKFVVDALGAIEAPAVPGLLLRALDDPEENVSAAAAEYLGRRREAAAVPALLRCLERGDLWLKFGCLRALGEIGDPAAAPAVAALLADPGLRKPALEALGRVGGAADACALVDALRPGERSLRRTAAVALRQVLERAAERGGSDAPVRDGIARIADGEFFEFLAGLLSQEDHRLRAAGAALLALAPGPEAVRVALGALPRATEQEQEQLARVLEAVPAERAAALVPHLADPTPAVRLRVAQALGRRRVREAVPALLTLLEDATGHVRAAAATALGAIGEPAAAAPLASLLRDPFPDVREAGVEALVAIGGGGEGARGLVLALLEPLLAAADPASAAASIRVVGRIGGGEMAARLGLALRDDRPEVRRSAVEALGAIGGPEAVAALRGALTDEDVGVRREVVLRVGSVRDPAAVPLLLTMLRDEDLWVRVRTVQALAAFDHPDARRVLLAAAADEPPGPKRLAAVRALGQGRVPGSLPVLTALAAAPDRETRVAAVEALGALGDPDAVPVLLSRLRDPEWGLRLAAVKALAPFAGGDDVRPALAAAARDDADPLVRSTAAGLLAPRAEPPG